MISKPIPTTAHEIISDNDINIIIDYYYTEFIRRISSISKRDLEIKSIGDIIPVIYPNLFILCYKYYNLLGFDIEIANEIYNNLYVKKESHARSTPNARRGGYYEKYMKYKIKYQALKRLGT
jgi:hypothetical protein